MPSHSRRILNKTFIRTYAPNSKDLKNLMQKDIQDLQKIIDDNKIMIASTNAVKMRRKIHTYFKNSGKISNSSFANVDILVEGAAARRRTPRDVLLTYDAIKRHHFPLYKLFRTEQFEKRGGDAISSALEVFLDLELRHFDKKLSEISSQIVERVLKRAECATKLIEKDYPNIPLSISPKYGHPNWIKAFSLEELQSDDNIPLNKRGSGLRRLAMLAFFQEEARRRRDLQDGDFEVPIIFAVEEPEISQHPNLLRDIVAAFRDLSNSGDQVIITTHAPDLMKILPSDSIRFIDRVRNRITPRVRSISSDNKVVKQIAENMGFHSKISSSDAQLIVWVEGISDIWALKNFASIISKCGKFPKNLEVDKILFSILGGYGNLAHNIDMEHNRLLNIPTFYLLDSDKFSSESVVNKTVEDLKSRVKIWNNTRKGEPIGYAITNKREIENYVHKDAIDKFYGSKIDWNLIDNSFDWDHHKICGDKRKHPSLFEILKKNGIDLKKRGTLKSTNQKQIVCEMIMKLMTIENIRQRCKTTNSTSSEVSEVEIWFRDMEKLISESTG